MIHYTFINIVLLQVYYLTITYSLHPDYFTIYPLFIHTKLLNSRSPMFLFVLIYYLNKTVHK